MAFEGSPEERGRRAPWKRVADLLRTELDGPAPRAMALIDIDEANGDWCYSLDGGETSITIGAVAADTALLLNGAALLRFAPTGGYDGGATFSFRGWDESAGVVGGFADARRGGPGTAFSERIASARIVSVSDDAGDRATSPRSGGVCARIADLIRRDQPARGEGGARAIAVIGVDDANGDWQYSLDAGDSYITIGELCEATALLLDGDALIRFQPSLGYCGGAAFAFRSWDGGVGVVGAVADTRLNGPDTAFGSDVDSARVAVERPRGGVETPRSDAPFPPAPPASDAQPSDPARIHELLSAYPPSEQISGGIAVVRADSEHGDWQYSLDEGRTYVSVGWIAPEAAILLHEDALLRFKPDGAAVFSARLDFRLWDQSVGVIGGVADTQIGGSSAFSNAVASIAADAGLDRPLRVVGPPRNSR